MNQLAKMIGSSDHNGTMAVKILLGLAVVFVALAILPSTGLV